MERRSLCWLLLVVLASLQIVNAQNTYIGAVVEHAPSKSSTAKDTILTNIKLYRGFMERARNQRADIIVFPEYGLTALVEDPEEYAISLSESRDSFSAQVLRDFEYAALEHNIYVVVNLLERDVNSRNQTIYYNTNLVFNRRGNITAKYRKINLYKEPKLTPGNELVTFSTDFGVNFGIMTCWDINYKFPAKDLLRYENVTDIVYPLAWSATMPFYMPLSVQQGYAQANGVNLLAANYDNPAAGNGGSGIYRSSGAVAQTYVDSTLSSQLIVQRLSKNLAPESTACRRIQPNALPSGTPGPIVQPNITNFVTYRDFVSSDYTFQNLDLSQFDISQQVCHRDLCCTFNITMGQANNNEVYKIMAFDGRAKLDNVVNHLRICSLLACKSNDVATCGERINGTTRFARIVLSGNLPLNSETFYQPLTLTYDLQPVADVSYCTTDQNSTSKVKLYTTRSQDKVLVFGMYGKTDSAGIKVTPGPVLIVLVALVKSLLFG